MLTRRNFDGAALAALALLLAGGPVRAEEPQGAPDRTGPVSGKDKPALDVAGGQERLGLALLDRIAAGAKGGDANLCVSPASVASALATIASAGDEDWQASVFKALQMPVGAKDQRAAMSQLRNVFARLRALDAGGPLQFADRLVIDSATKPFDATLLGLRALVDTQEADLTQQKSVDEINAWVNEKTRGAIDRIIDRPPGRNGFVSLNALHFKDRWQTPFDPARTTTDDFRLNDGGSVPVAMMNRPGAFSARTSPKLVAVDLPFGHDRYSLVLATGADKPLKVRELAAEAAGWLSGAGFATAHGDLAAPKLDLAASVDLLGALQALGLKDKPLVGLGAKPPRISAISQRTMLRMNEEGAEAAAATAVVGTRSMPADYVKLRFDRPFLYALRDRESGVMLLVGYVAKPGAA